MFVLGLSVIYFVVIVVFDTLCVFFVFVCELLMVPYFFVWILCCRLVVFFGGNIVIVLGIVVWLVDIFVFVL